MHADLETVLITEDQIAERIDSLAIEIMRTYTDAPDGVTIVPVLSGAVMFLADLIRKLPIKMRLGMLSVSSYPGTSTTPQPPVVNADLLPDIRGRDVLIVDDIFDSGATLRVVQARLRAKEPRSLRTAVLLRKPGRAPADVPVEFIGFDVEDVFVVGYGLDYGDLYRNLPVIGVLKPAVYEKLSHRETLT